MTKFNVKKYENLYMKMLYISLAKRDGNNNWSIQIRDSGNMTFIVSISDGYKQSNMRVVSGWKQMKAVVFNLMNIHAGVYDRYIA